MSKLISIFIIIVLTGSCASTPPEAEQVQTTHVQVIQSNFDNYEKVRVTQALEFKFKTHHKSGLKRYNLSQKGIVKPGVYRAYARGPDATYYSLTKDKGKGVKVSFLGLFDNLAGGIKIPDHPEGEYRAWSLFIESHVSGGKIATYSDRNFVYEYPVIEGAINFIVKSEN